MKHDDGGGDTRVVIIVTKVSVSPQAETSYRNSQLFTGCFDSLIKVSLSKRRPTSLDFVKLNHWLLDYRSDVACLMKAT